ncbi:SET domain-containing protein [Streptomyces sp. 8K308]|uniref:SET domain-containing protein n=1 Tax=Streptomyces sp. 8K308 TaxID=2530388 RepID=UPI0010497B17|nr:SET domain-containing protein-lysine N-methyltransferase [Streptomyces sp. 8K308]TDC23845.1 SET domain-containing protein [Streptomyces sp. 8K308]
MRPGPAGRHDRAHARTAPAAPHRLLAHRKAEVRASPIQGLGLFAIAPLRAGEAVQRVGGELIDDAALATLEPPYSSITVDEDRHLLIDPAEPVRYGNHSCEPTLWHADAFTLVARRDIAVGEELTSDYATHTGVDAWAMDCRCGSRVCRGRVTGRDWRLPALRAAYGRHWIPPLLRRIDAGGGIRQRDQPATGTESEAAPGSAATGSA